MLYVQIAWKLVTARLINNMSETLKTFFFGYIQNIVVKMDQLLLIMFLVNDMVTPSSKTFDFLKNVGNVALTRTGK